MGGKLAAAFSIGAVMGALRNLKQFVDEIKDTSDAIGISAEALQELNYAFMHSGGGVKEFQIAIKSLAKTREDALNGEDKSIALLKKYGVSVADVKAMDADQLFMAMAAAINKIPDPLTKAAAAADLFGAKAGAKLIPALKDLEKFRNESKTKILSNDDIAVLDSASDKLDEIILKTKQLAGKGVARFGGSGLDDLEKKKIEHLAEVMEPVFKEDTGNWVAILTILSKYLKGTKEAPNQWNKWEEEFGVNDVQRGMELDKKLADLKAKRTKRLQTQVESKAFAEEDKYFSEGGEAQKEHLKNLIEAQDDEAKAAEQAAQNYIAYIESQDFLPPDAKDEKIKAAIESGMKITSPSAANSLQRSGLFGSVSSLAGGSSPSALLREIVRSNAEHTKILRAIESKKEFVWPT